MIEMLTAGPTGKPSPTEPKYLELLAYMDSLSVPTVDISANLFFGGGNRRNVDMTKGVEGNMQGSSWSPGAAVGANIGRIVQHLCPSQEMYNRQKQEGRHVFLQVGFGAQGQLATTLPSVNRNGYTSAGVTIPKGTTYIRFETFPSLVYYDSELDGLYAMQGSNKSGPVLWTIPA